MEDAADAEKELEVGAWEDEEVPFGCGQGITEVSEQKGDNKVKEEKQKGWSQVRGWEE